MFTNQAAISGRRTIHFVPSPIELSGSIQSICSSKKDADPKFYNEILSNLYHFFIKGHLYLAIDFYSNRFLKIGDRDIDAEDISIKPTVLNRIKLFSDSS